MKERLHKILAQRGLCSRRRAEDLIREGRVLLNGVVVRALGTVADSDVDNIVVDGRVVPLPKLPRLLALHKPVGYLCTSRKGREHGPTVFDLMPRDRRYFTIGRLDRESSGLLLVTDNGDLAERLAHPRYETIKTYIVETDQPLTRDARAQLCAGVMLEDGVARAEAVTLITGRRIKLELIGGRKRQIRRMLRVLGRQVVNLHRVEIGSFRLGRLPVGEWCELSEADVRTLMTPPNAARRSRKLEETENVSDR